jgi:hypothetical protein
MKPHRLPRLKKKEEQNDEDKAQKSNKKKETGSSNKKMNKSIKTSIKRNINSDYIQKYGKIRDRHNEDYAISLAPDREDIISEDAKLFDNKDINLEMPKIKENIGLEDTEFYIESIHHDQYYKINQIKKEEKPSEEIFGEKKVGIKKRKKSTVKKLSAYDQAQAIENKLYQKFDKELTDVITKTLSKVTLIFLFAQGLLAGMGLLHILITLTYSNYEQYIQQLANMVIIMFNIFHALTFTSLVGNGIKFVSSLQKYKLINMQINSNTSEFTKLRQNMIFSGILLVFFAIVFGIEIYLSTFVQEINIIKCRNETQSIIKESDYNPFKICHLILDFVVIILFILNIFDLNVNDESQDTKNRPINLNFYLGSEPTKEDVNP